MLKFINGDGTECIPADTTAEAWHTLCGQRTVQLIAGKNIQFEDTDTDALMIATSFTDTPEHRYQQYIHSKQLAMAYGNERAGVTDVDYQFTAGYEGAIYAPGGHPYVKTIQTVSAADDGNLSVLSSECVGIDAIASRDQQSIVFCKDGSNCDPCESYVELNAFVWRLYHALNDVAYHLLGFDPTRQYWGTLMSYQGMVARWNTFIWQQSYQFRAVPLRDTLTIELSYTCVRCVETNVKIHAILTLEHAEPAAPAAAGYASAAYWLALYSQGESKRGSFEPVIQQTVEYKNGMTREESGYGSDPIPEGQWTTRYIDITIPEMHQNDYYTKAFVLSLSQQYYKSSAQGSYYLPEPDEVMPEHIMSLKTTWSATDSIEVTKQEDDIRIIALQAYVPASSSSSSGESA